MLYIDYFNFIETIVKIYWSIKFCNIVNEMLSGAVVGVGVV